MYKRNMHSWFPKDDVVSLIHVLEVDAVSARDAAQQRLLEAFARNGEGSFCHEEKDVGK